MESSHPFICPHAVDSQKALVLHIMDMAHWIGTTLLARFSQSLSLEQSNELQRSHRPEKLSTSALGLLKYLPSSPSEGGKLGQIAHTDVGSITLLFSRLGGLQVLEHTTSEWAYVQPKPGHAVVNVGDSLRFLSHKALRSSLHRVVPHPDAERETRYSIAYFMRPEVDAEFDDEEGKPWTGISWHTRKFAVFRAPLEEQRKTSVLTGKKGYVGLWVDNGTKGPSESSS
jgi:isopenicillin N synthase-like dioxygenase